MVDAQLYLKVIEMYLIFNLQNTFLLENNYIFLIVAQLTVYCSILLEYIHPKKCSIIREC